MLSIFLTFWHWFGLAAVLLILELLSGSGFLLGISISAAMMGCILFFIPTLSLTIQLFVFSVFSILSIWGYKYYLTHRSNHVSRPILNRRGELYIGRTFTLTQAVVNGMGVVHVDDTTWRIRCIDLPAGTKIKIVGVDGVILLAEPVI
jgi:membrane protein implicated in regulation of membrane protease activity